MEKVGICWRNLCWGCFWMGLEVDLWIYGRVDVGELISFECCGAIKRDNICLFSMSEFKFLILFIYILEMIKLNYVNDHS